MNSIKNLIAILVLVLLIFVEVFYFTKDKNKNYLNNTNSETSIDISIESSTKTSTVASIVTSTVKETTTNTKVESAKKTEIVETAPTLVMESAKIIDPDKKYEFATASELYFKNSLFIGDSRTDGFKVYKHPYGMAFYSNPTFGVFSGFDKEMEVDGVGNTTLRDLLTKNKFDKIYIMLGINNVRAGIENHQAVYKSFLDTIIEYQPDAIIYLLTNFHVTKDCMDDSVNNTKIDQINKFIKEFDDGKRIFCLDVSSMFDDSEGYLDKELASDSYHVKSKYYDRFLYYLLTHAIIR